MIVQRSDNCDSSAMGIHTDGGRHVHCSAEPDCVEHVLALPWAEAMPEQDELVAAEAELCCAAAAAAAALLPQLAMCDP